MTVSNTQIRVNYTGDGTSTAFPIPYPFYLATDILVLLAGVTQGSGYTISGGEDASGNPQTGTCTFATPPASGVSVTLILNVPLTQLVALVDGTAFPSATVNQVNDRAIQAALRMNDLISRAIRAPDGDTNPLMTLPSAASRAGLMLTFDGNGNPLPAPQPVAGSVTQSLIGQLLWPQTGAEVTAGVTPANYAYPPGNVLRYGADPAGSISSLTAFNNAYAVAMANTPHLPIYMPAGTYLIPNPGLTWTNQNDITVYGDGPNQSVLTYSGSNYTLLTISADTGLGTTGTNLQLHDFGIAAMTGGTGVNALAVADYEGFDIFNLQLHSSGTALKMSGMAVGSVDNINCLTAATNAAGNSALILGPDTHGNSCGPLTFTGCSFNGQGNVTIGGAVWTSGAFGCVFDSCMFIAWGPSVSTVFAATNGDDITVIGCYSESSRNTTTNDSGSLFHLGLTTAPQQFSIVGGTYFTGAGGFVLKNAVFCNKVQALTVDNATFANFGTSGITFATTAASMISVRNTYCTGAGNPPVIDPSVPGAPNSNYLTSFHAPWDAADVSLGATVANVTGDGTVYTVLFDTKHIDNTGGYSQGTGIFAASQSGLYEVYAAVMVNGLSASWTGMEMDIVQKSSGGVVLSTHAISTNPGAVKNAANQAMLGQTCLLNCSKGDQISVSVMVSGSTKAIGVVGAAVEYTRLSLRFMG